MGKVMVTTISFSVSRRSDTAGLPEFWILDSDWVKFRMKAATLGFVGLGAPCSSKEAMYCSARDTFIFICRMVSMASSYCRSVGRRSKARA